MKKTTILSVLVASLLLVGCNDDKTAQTAVTAEKTEAVKVETTKEKATEALEMAKAMVSDTKDKVSQKATQAVADAKEVASDAKAVVTEKATQAVADAKEVVSDAKESVKEKVTQAKAVVTEKVAEAKEAVSKATEAKVEAPASFTACVACHGKDGKTKALGKSAIIAGQSKEDISTKLNGYKAGTLNVTGMGSLMKGQASKLSDANIEEIATYLSAIK